MLKLLKLVLLQNQLRRRPMKMLVLLRLLHQPAQKRIRTMILFQVKRYFLRIISLMTRMESFHHTGNWKGAKV